MNNFKALDYQIKTYVEGANGKMPLVSPDWVQLKKDAIAKMEPNACSYIIGAAGLQHTMLNNRLGFDRLKIIPRMLKNVESRDTSINLFGINFPSPFFLCPIGVAEMVHADADIAIAKGTSSTGIPYIFSNQASFKMEDCANEMGSTPFFFQLYWSKSKELVSSLVKRAEACGAKAIIVTLDTTLLGWRTKDLALGYLPFLQGKGIAQYTSDPVFMQMVLENVKKENTENFATDSVEYKKLIGVNAVRLFTQIYTNSATTWEDLKFLREQTNLPIILKGILHKDDAELALQYGMDGIYVSNHGGRQVDGSIATIDALPAILEVVKNKIPILFDSGIRGGADMFKAIAMGASAVGLGRPYIYGLTLAGADGVTEVIRQLQADFELTMALAGCKNVSEINRVCLAN